MGKSKQLFKRIRSKKASPSALVIRKGRIELPGYLCGFKLATTGFDEESDLIVDGKFFTQTHEKMEKNV